MFFFFFSIIAGDEFIHDWRDSVSAMTQLRLSVKRGVKDDFATGPGDSGCSRILENYFETRSRRIISTRASRPSYKGRLIMERGDYKSR